MTEIEFSLGKIIEVVFGHKYLYCRNTILNTGWAATGGRDGKYRLSDHHGTGLALSVDGNNPNPNSQLILNNSDPKNPLQICLPIFYPPTQANILFHPQTGLYAAPTELKKGAPVVLFKVPTNLSFDGAHTWQIVGGGPFVVRPPKDTDLNLNALGSSWPVGTKIGIWSWGGGTPNEVWKFTLHSA